MKEKTPKPVSQKSKKLKGHRFYLNPYDDMGCTKCPKCEAPTRIRKFPLVIHIEPLTIFTLNKKCRYCVLCDLIIAKKSELEDLITVAAEQNDPSIIGNEYLVVGTIERGEWQNQYEAHKKGELREPEPFVDQVAVFRDVWDFKVIGGWMREEDYKKAIEAARGNTTKNSKGT